MILAVISDIHSNHPALEACIREAVKRGAEGFLFLGDYVTDCAYPQKTLHILYEMRGRFPCRFIRGNREEYLIDYRANGEKGWENGSEHGSLLYTYENLTDRDIDWFESLDHHASVDFPGANGGPIFICHGSPKFSRGRLTENLPETSELLSGVEEPTVLHGHDHAKAAYTALGKRVVNPGSAGVSLEGIPGVASMALLYGENGGWKEELLNFPYDVESAVKELETSGLISRAPVWAAAVRETLLTGRNITQDVLNRASELSRQETGEAGKIPEKFWEQAAVEFGL